MCSRVYERQSGTPQSFTTIDSFLIHQSLLYCCVVVREIMKLPSLLIPTLAVLTVAKKSKETNYPLEVTLKPLEGSVVNVTIANKGGKDINLFSRATILDPNPVRKLNVTSTTGKDTMNL
jgi:hypothetical protein